MKLLIFTVKLSLVFLVNLKYYSFKNKTQIFCNNNFNIASSKFECIIPKNNCNKEKPFNCSVNGIMTCVKSQTDCDCPQDYYKCNYMKYCVPGNRKDMCPKFYYRNCNEINNKWDYYNDGICRNKNYIQPSQRVSPIGKILCPDLSCEDNYNNCKMYDILLDGKTRCVNQDLTQYAYECQSTITCSDSEKVVCPNGKCVENEIFCKNMIECPIDNPFLCKYNNKCVKSFQFCEINKKCCGDGLSLCEDYVCRENCSNIDYDNSPYVIENCILSPKNGTFIAGNNLNFTLVLKTEKGLLYNGDIDINNDIIIELENNDISFNYNITKSPINNANFTITIYSHIKGKNTLQIFIKSKEKTEFVSSAQYYVYPDFESTYIIEEHLKYTAGKTGYMILELRTKNNISNNYWEGNNFTVKSSDTTDNTFAFSKERAGTLGVLFITVTSQKANKYPKRKVTLDIFLNGVEIKSYKPEMEVSPDKVVRTEILDKYYKDKSNNVLLDGIADKNYVFEVASYDKFDNLAETIQEVVGIKVALKGDAANKATSITDQETGFRKYNASVTKAGRYVVSSDKSGPFGLYLYNELIFDVIAGEIDLSKTLIKAKYTSIKAGSKPGITLEAFDYYDNSLSHENYIDKFTAVFIDSKNDTHSSTGSFNGLLDKVEYISNTKVTEIGFIIVKVAYNEKYLFDTSHVVIEVIPVD